jgi:TonB family protein
VQIFELVAGPPTDLTATEAPALGSADGQVEVKINEKPVKSDPTPPEAAPAVRPETKPVPLPETKTIPKAPAKTGPKITYKDFVAKHPRPAPSKPAASGSSAAAKAPQLKTHGIPDGVVGGSSRSHGGGGGNALTAAEHSALEAYVARLVAALRQNHQKPPGLSSLMKADVEYLVAADGTISNVSIAQSSGNAEFDQSCIEAFIQMGSAGPTPDGKAHTWITTFRMFEPPD